MQEFYGCGKFTSDSYRIFCRGDLSGQVNAIIINGIINDNEVELQVSGQQAPCSPSQCCACCSPRQRCGLLQTHSSCTSSRFSPLPWYAKVTDPMRS